MSLYESIQALYPTAVAEVVPGDGGDYRLGYGADGLQQIDYWNETKLGPRPTQTDLARGWYLHIHRRKKAEFAARGVRAMRQSFPEVDTLREHHPDLNDADVAIWMFVMLMFSNANDLKAVGVKGARDKMISKMAQVDAIKPGVAPTQAVFERLASDVAAIPWEV